MRYLSIDLEATGLNQDDFMIEFAMAPFDTEARSVEVSMSKRWIIKCPKWDDLLPKLNPWVIEHNEAMIKDAHLNGISLNQLKQELTYHLKSKDYQDYFGKEKIVLFGKSMNAIDLPFLNRDLGWDWMRETFCHRNLDFSGVCYAAMDMKLLPAGSESGSQLMKFLKMGVVAHNAMDDAINTAKMYFKVLDLYKTLLPVDTIGE